MERQQLIILVHKVTKVSKDYLIKLMGLDKKKALRHFK